MPIFDSHCHYNLEPLAENWQHHWQNAQDKNVTDSVVVGVNVSTSHTALELAQKSEHLYAAVGIHPNAWHEEKTLSVKTAILEIKKLISESKSESKVVAIGETGLDYFRLPHDPQLSNAIRDTQRQGLEAHIQLALEANLPLILHVRDQTVPESPTKDNAYWDILTTLKANLTPGHPFVLHCVSGPQVYLKTALELGAYVGIAGNSTYKNAHSLRELIKMVPSERILLETDAPFLPPQQFRGKTCEPWMISQTEEFLRTEMKIDTEQVFATTHSFFKTKA